jgi:serine/threonine protein kinase/tetratricopeptide (TPR) repeat protein
VLTPLPGRAPQPRSPSTDAPTRLPKADPKSSYAEAAPTMMPGPPIVSTGDSGPLEPGQAFGARYHIIRMLGVGGMGAVYQAWDAELGVAVAIKVIRPEVMADATVAAGVERRFKRELLLARQVTHKNVVRIHDIGEIDGIKYITMSYVEGTDLATLASRGERLPVSTVLRIVRSVVSGLAAAHAAGVVHRDLKPANIMIGADGEALIMDFGIARSTGDARGDAASVAGPLPAQLQRTYARPDATMAGTIVGTVEYMAPEQAKGQEVDQRADVYAFGLILYDLLVGRLREHADGAVAELQRRMLEAPPPVKSVVPQISEALDRIVSRCLEPDRDKRYETAAALAADLDRLDANGEPIPIRRVVRLSLLVAVVSLLLMLTVGTWWSSRQSLPAAPHDPVSVLIADFQNGTGDQTFDGTLEPMLRRALEGAGFITAYDRSSVSRTLGVRPPATMDEVAARELAVKQGLGVVVSGSINPQRNGYAISVKAAESVTGNVLTTAEGRAPDKDRVLEVATRLIADVRQALGDETPDSAQMFAMSSLSATSLDVVRHYAAAQDAMSNNRFDDARQSASKAVELDPKFGIGYQVLAVASRNLGNLQDSEKYINEALRYLDGMTERERFSTRGMFYRVTGDYQQCVKEYGDLIARFAADVIAHNQLALCSTQLRDLRRAVDEMRQVVDILPRRALFRVNLSWYASYAGDFQMGEEEARAIEGPDRYAMLALAFAQLGQGQLPEALKTYERLATIDVLGASMAASGLGDLAIHEGRFADAVRILEQGAAADVASGGGDRAAAKFAAIASVQLLRGQKSAAISAAEKALANSRAVKIRFVAARSLVHADAIASARPLISGLASDLQAEPQAYAKIVEGNIALANGGFRQAITLLGEANGLLDTWIGHFDLGRAYLEAGQFAQADSEFDRCIKRRGEALSLFLDEEPTFGYLPPVYYYQGRVREGLKSAGFAESYRTYLTMRGKSTEDPLLPDVRRRAGG